MSRNLKNNASGRGEWELWIGVHPRLSHLAPVQRTLPLGTTHVVADKCLLIAFADLESWSVKGIV